MSAIFGRDREISAARAWLAGDADAAFLIEGEAGIGKTTLWRWAADEAARRGSLVLSCSPVESEARLAFAGLADLLAPILAEALDAVPPPQRRALDAALLIGERASAPPDERAVAFALLTVLRRVGSSGALVIAIDDTQWLDPSSAVTLGYALRRAGEAGVKALLARRTRPGEADDQLVAGVSARSVQGVVLGGLSLGALHRLIRNELGVGVARPTLVRIHESSGGNPMHAVELARVAARDRLPGRRGALEPLESLLATRVAMLSEETRHALTLAAAAVDPTVSLLDQVLGGRAAGLLEPARQASLVEVTGGHVRFGHPLLAAAVRRAASAEETKEAHRRVAAVADSLEERAVHLRLAADGPDAAVADLLDEAARSARARGALATVADLLELAAQATPEDAAEQRAMRLVESAHASFASGDSGRARTLLEEVAAHDGPARYRALWLLGLVLDEAVGGDAAVGSLRAALRTDDPALAAAVHRSLAQTLFYTESFPAALEHADASVSIARGVDDGVEVAYSLAVQALVRFWAGRPGWRASLDEALAIEARIELPDPDLCPSAIAADVDRACLRLDDARDRCERLRRSAGERQDARTEAWALFGLGQVELLAGRLPEAGRYVDELLELSEQTELFQLPALRNAALHAGLTGDLDRARLLLAELVEKAEGAGELLNLRQALTAKGLLELSQGDGAAAMSALRRARELSERQQVGGPSLLLAQLDEVEACSLAADLDTGREVLAALLAGAAGGEEPWMEPLALRARALVTAAEGGLGDAIDLLREATAREEAMPVPLERARAWLALGRILRRAKRRAEARVALETAQSRFEELGMPVWAAQTREELARIGGRKRADGLTPTETRVASLVASGLSNKEAAAALFVSVKTVEANLSRAYAKLGVRNRAALAGALADQSRGKPPLSGRGAET